MNGMAEDYFQLGVHLRATGKYQLKENEAFFFRPPGYPYFISYALRIYDEVLSNKESVVVRQFSNREEMQRALQGLKVYLYFAQNVLFSLTVLMFFGIALRFVKPTYAFFLSLLLGCNPYFLIHVGLLHYEILHIFLLVLGLFFLIKVYDQKPWGYVWLIISGLCFGLATLVRPITLILPPFVFLAFLVTEKRKFIPAAIKTLMITFCMIIIIAPYSWRNYDLSNTFIPVNAQGGVALWAGTAKTLPIHPNHYRWWDLWRTEGMPIYQKVAGKEPLTNYSWAHYNLELEKEFKKEAYSNIRKQPFIYAYNVIANFISMNFCINAVFLKIFDFIQLPGAIFDKTMLNTNNDQTFHKDFQSNMFTLLVIILTICSGIGIFLGIRNNDFSILPILAVYLCVTIAHSITYMDIMYYYVKMPFIFIFFAYFLKQLTALENNKFNIIRHVSIALPGLLTLILLFNLVLN